MEFLKNVGLFGRTRALESQIDEFLDGVSQSGLLFKLAIKIYLIQGATLEFEEKLSQVNELESRGDMLRRKVEQELYSHMLLPESRGDVLSLLENLDSILNRLQGTLWAFSIETPDILEEFKLDFQTLAEVVTSTVEEVVMASRAYFRKIESVGDHTHKVMFYEKEADRTCTKLKRAIFNSDLPLANKNHLRHFVEEIDNAANRAEDVADQLTIFSIKQRV